MISEVLLFRTRLGSCRLGIASNVCCISELIEMWVMSLLLMSYICRDLPVLSSHSSSDQGNVNFIPRKPPWKMQSGGGWRAGGKVEMRGFLLQQMWRSVKTCWAGWGLRSGPFKTAQWKPLALRTFPIDDIQRSLPMKTSHPPISQWRVFVCFLFLMVRVCKTLQQIDPMIPTEPLIGFYSSLLKDVRVQKIRLGKK